MNMTFAWMVLAYLFVGLQMIRLMIETKRLDRRRIGPDAPILAVIMWPIALFVTAYNEAMDSVAGRKSSLSAPRFTIRRA